MGRGGYFLFVEMTIWAFRHAYNDLEIRQYYILLGEKYFLKLKVFVQVNLIHLATKAVGLICIKNMFISNSAL